MKNKKIVWFLILVQILGACLILSAAATSDTQELSFTLEADTSKVNASGNPVYNAGDVITLTVAVNENPGFMVMGTTLTYDPSVLEVVLSEDRSAEKAGSVYADASYFVINNPEDGRLVISIGNPFDIWATIPLEKDSEEVLANKKDKFEALPRFTATGTMVTFKFKLAEDYAGGPLDINLSTSNGLIYDLSGNTGDASDLVINTPAVKLEIMGINPTTHVHTYADATCTEPKICTVCTEIGGPALGHAYGTLIAEIPAGCETEGTIAHYHCTACDKDFDVALNEVTDLTIPAKGHNYGELIAKVDANCTETGTVAHYHCVDCDKNFDENKAELATIVIPAKGHVYGELIAKVDATCTDPGAIAYYQCAACSLKFNEAKYEVTDIVVPALGHNYGDLYAKKDATCTETGTLAHYTCSRCEKNFDENKAVLTDLTIPLVAHVEVVDPAKDATCTETGLTEGKHCANCPAVLVAQEEVPAKGHTTAVDAGKEATCTEKGLTEGQHCSVCEEVLVAQEEIPAKGHTSVDVPAVDPTEEETGLTAGKKCSVCDEVLTAQESVPMLETGCCSGGCGSILSVSGALLIMSVLGVAVVIRKKED